jgi:chemotaxis protein MotB
MKLDLKSTRLLLSFVAPVVVSGCVWKSDYEKLQAQNQQLEQQVSRLSSEVSADKVQIARLVGAIKYTVNSDQLFPSGSYQMSPQGQDIIAKFAARLAPTQQNKLVVNGYTDNAPIGPELQRQGITSNQILSQKRAESVTAFLISQGVKPDLVSAVGHGAADPIATNSTPAGRAQNRRVELAIASPGS